MCAHCKNIKLAKGEGKQTKIQQGKFYTRRENTLRVLFNTLEKVSHYNIMKLHTLKRKLSC